MISMTNYAHRKVKKNPKNWHRLHVFKLLGQVSLSYCSSTRQQLSEMSAKGHDKDRGHNQQKCELKECDFSYHTACIRVMILGLSSKVICSSFTSCQLITLTFTLEGKAVTSNYIKFCKRISILKIIMDSLVTCHVWTPKSMSIREH